MHNTKKKKGLPSSSMSYEPACNAEDLGSIPGLGRSPGEGNGNPLQYSCLENPRGQRSLASYTVHGVSRVRRDSATKPPPHHTTNNRPQTCLSAFYLQMTQKHLDSYTSPQDKQLYK